MKKDNKIALVHDFLTGLGGAENVLGAIAEVYDKSDVFTLISDKSILKDTEFDWIRKKKVTQSFLQKFPKFFRERRKWLLPLMPTAIETLDFRDYDLVISSSGAFSKGIVVKSKTTHVCYVHSPLRYVWDWHHQYLEENYLKGKTKFFLRFFLSHLRMWDRASAMRPDFLIANSKYTRDRIRKYYRRESEVIYPSVEVGDFKPTKENQGYFLTVSRLSAYKRVDVLIEAFAKLNLPLVIVGEGAEKKNLQNKIEELGVSSKIKLVGGVDREKLIRLYENSRAFVFAAEEDFGIAVVEAMAAGKPVIALGRGGTAETVQEGKTGEFFEEAKADLVVEAVKRFLQNEREYDFREIRKHAEKFGKERFQRELASFIKDSIKY